MLRPALADAERTVFVALGRFNVDTDQVRGNAQIARKPKSYALAGTVHGLDSFGTIPLGGKVE